MPLIRPFALWPLPWHLLLALLTVVVMAGGTWRVWEAQRAETVRLERELAEERLALARLSQEVGRPQRAASIDPGSWPQRSAVDDVVRWASESAKAEGLTLQLVRVSHQAATAQSWGTVTLSVSTQGTYTAHKVWQGLMQDKFDALAVQSLSLNDASNGQEGNAGAGLNGSWVWVLYVRD